MTIRIVIADDHPIVLKGLQGVLATEPDFQVVAHCADGDETLEAIRARQPDILVLDLHMPGKNGLQALSELKASKTLTRVVLLAAALDDEELLEAARQGVAGVVLKEMKGCPTAKTGWSLSPPGIN
jgi:DNA-binding NarL/FixJ family response regulator